MNSARTTFAFAIVAFLLAASVPDASAQLFGRKRKVMSGPGKMISRQGAAKVDKSLEGQVTQENSTVIISLSKQRAYLKARDSDQIYVDTPISSGKRAGMTPTGSFTVLEKDPDHRSSVYGDFVDGKG